MDESINGQKPIKSLMDRFKEIEGYFYGDTKTISFCKHNIYSTDIHVINRKLGGLAINELLSESEYKILKANASSKSYFEALREEELSTYKLLTTDLEPNNKTQLVASTYLNAHKPQLFPVWDHNYAHLLLPEHEEYATFKEALDTWKKINGLETLNYYELHKFLWLYRDAITRELKAG